MDYFQQIEICVKKLREFLEESTEEERNEHSKVLTAEREGWVEYQMIEWCASEIKAEYKFDVWNTPTYFFIDVYVTLISSFPGAAA